MAVVIDLEGWTLKAKARPRVTTNGTYMPGGYQDWMNETRYALLQRTKGLPLERPISVSIEIHAPTRGRGDLDNLAGGLLDAGNGILWKDDRQVQALAIRWHQTAKERRVRVIVRPYLASLCMEVDDDGTEQEDA
jgi:Holliday junction resolvase RusA-like endonuclease